MPLSAEQITDLENTIMMPIEMIDIEDEDGNAAKAKSEASRNLLIQYLLNATENNLREILADKEARNALEDILEQKYLVADLWLNNKIFLNKGKKDQGAPTIEEIATIMFYKLVGLRKNGGIASKENSFIYRALVEKKTVDLEKEESKTIQDLLDAAYSGNTTYLKKNLKKADINKTYPPYGGTLLSYAVTGGQLKTVEYLLNDCNADPNIADRNNNLPLQWAALKLMPEDPSTQTISRTSTPVTLDKNRLQIVERLLDVGSKVDVKDKQNESPLDILGKISQSHPQNNECGRIFNKAKIHRDVSQNLGKQTEKIDSLMRHENIQTLIDRFSPEIVTTIRLSHFPSQLLTHKFITPDKESLTLLEWLIQKSASLEQTTRDKVFKLIKQCTQSCPSIIQQVSQGQYTSPLTFALEQAFQARYTQKETYLNIAQYLLQQGAKAGTRDREIIESFYPDIPENILKLTNFKTEFEGLSAQASRHDAEQAQKIVFERTGIQFEIELKQGFVLQHQQNFHPMEHDLRRDQIQKAYVDHQLGLQEESKGLNMGWSQVKLTIPTQIIPQICQNNFSVLIRQEGKAAKLRQQLRTKQADEEAKIRAIQAAARELNLSRTKASATQAYEKLNALMPNQWQMVPTQEGYALQYDIGFTEEKEKFDRSTFHKVINFILSVDIQERRVATSRGSSLYQLVITPTDLQKLKIIDPESINQLTNTLWPTDPNNKPNLYYVLKLIELNPALKEKSFAYKGATPLSLAVADADIDAVKKLLDIGGIEINKEDDKGNTPLKWAILKASPTFRDQDFAPEKRERYKQIALLLIRKGAKFDLEENYSGQSARALLQTHCPGWEPELEREWNKLNPVSLDLFEGNLLTLDVDQLTALEKRHVESKHNPSSASSTASSTSKKQYRLDKDTAGQLLQQYRPALLQLQNIIQVYLAHSLLRCDDRFIPNIIAALEAIAEEKAFVPAASFGISPLPNNAHECLEYVLESRSSSSSTAQFVQMVAHFCDCANEPGLKGTLDRFIESIISNLTNTHSTTASSTSSSPSSVSTSSSTSSSSSTSALTRTPASSNPPAPSTARDTHIENLIDAWKIPQSDQNEALNKVSVHLDGLKRECTNEINALKNDVNSPPEKVQNVAAIVTLTGNLVDVLNKEQNLTARDQKIQELVEDFRKQAFTVSERFYIAVISFIDSVLSVIMSIDSSKPAEGNSRFRFFKPFEKEPVKREYLEFSEALNASRETAPATLTH